MFPVVLKKYPHKSCYKSIFETDWKQLRKQSIRINLDLLFPLHYYANVVEADERKPFEGKRFRTRRAFPL